MVALDTNIVVRMLTGDDPDQLARVHTLLTSNQGWISSTVLLETAWVLGSVYGYGKATVLEALNLLAGFPAVVLQDMPVLRHALDWASGGMDLADALHLAQARECEAFVTFDRDLIRSATALGQVVREP